LVVAFTTAWVEALNRIVSTSKSEDVWFMDGPYAVELSMSDPEMVEAGFVHDQLKGKAFCSRPVHKRESLF
jgi:hypothetical protein